MMIFLITISVIVVIFLIINKDFKTTKQAIAIKAQTCGIYRTRFLHNGENFPLTIRSCWNCANSVLGKCKAIPDKYNQSGQ
ncbi:hypothetical protein HNR33_002133 [Brassicibacter mesophilus]